MTQLMKGLAMVCLVLGLVASLVISISVPSMLHGRMTFDFGILLVGLFTTALTYGLLGSIGEALQLLTEIRDRLSSQPVSRSASAESAGNVDNSPRYQPITSVWGTPEQNPTIKTNNSTPPLHTVVCSHCGAVNPSFEVNCTHCGKRL